MPERPDRAGRADIKVPAGLRRETVERMRRPEVADRESVDRIAENFIDAGSYRLLIPGASRQPLVTLGLVEHSSDSAAMTHQISSRGVNVH
jgi:hypothetical protein